MEKEKNDNNLSDNLDGKTKEKKPPILIIFLIWTFVLSGLLLMLNLITYGTNGEATTRGIMVYASYAGTFMSVMIWTLVPALIYRGICKVFSKTYKSKTEWTLIVIFFIFALLGSKENIANL